MNRRYKQMRSAWTLFCGCACGLRAPRLLAVLLSIALGGAAWNAAAQTDDGDETNREYAIKAAYLYQFGRYVQWPPDSFADSRAPLVIGILGRAPFGDILDEIARNKHVEGRPIVIRRFASMADYKPCHILFVTASVDEAEATAAISMAKKAPVLLVGEEPGFIQEGGLVNFFMDGNRIRFEINAEAARHERLKISSKLLNLAKIVEPGAQ